MVRSAVERYRERVIEIVRYLESCLFIYIVGILWNLSFEWYWEFK